MRRARRRAAHRSERPSRRPRRAFGAERRSRRRRRRCCRGSRKRANFHDVVKFALALLACQRPPTAAAAATSAIGCNREHRASFCTSAAATASVALGRHRRLLDLPAAERPLRNARLLHVAGGSSRKRRLLNTKRWRRDESLGADEQLSARPRRKLCRLNARAHATATAAAAAAAQPHDELDGRRDAARVGRARECGCAVAGFSGDDRSTATIVGIACLRSDKQQRRHCRRN